MKEAKAVEEKSKNKKKNLKKKKGSVTCHKCGSSRFRTVEKGYQYKCRNCGTLFGASGKGE